MHVNSASLQAELLPLLKGNFIIQGITLNQPEINLEINQNGQKNWEAKEGKTALSSSMKGGSNQGSTSNKENQLNIAKVKIIDGKLRYIDTPKQSTVELLKVNLDTSHGLGTLTFPLMAALIIILLKKVS